MKNRQIWLIPCLPVFFKRALFHGQSFTARTVVVIHVLRYVSQRIQLICDWAISRYPYREMLVKRPKDEVDNFPVI